MLPLPRPAPPEGTGRPAPVSLPSLCPHASTPTDRLQNKYRSRGEACSPPSISSHSPLQKPSVSRRDARSGRDRGQRGLHSAGDFRDGRGPFPREARWILSGHVSPLREEVGGSSVPGLQGSGILRPVRAEAGLREGKRNLFRKSARIRVRAVERRGVASHPSPWGCFAFPEKETFRENRLGVSDECCRIGCTETTLKSYCAPSEDDYGDPDLPRDEQPSAVSARRPEQVPEGDASARVPPATKVSRGGKRRRGGGGGGGRKKGGARLPRGGGKGKRCRCRRRRRKVEIIVLQTDAESNRRPLAHTSFQIGTIAPSFLANLRVESQRRLLQFQALCPDIPDTNRLSRKCGKSVQQTDYHPVVV
ncbi:hypothetical protein J437_LFUL005548 [Ladona fulva]|uniref:Insulin-like domain-containing protein n=1 Tax=Ladona fulva TaxID=123851 RepID=A0A8K0NY70_LADFU|nr:hypothetical protein J437_LFUL005548 [Ladona fulva]